MKRKTNLFYSGLSTDTNFLTFSNYPESLTGNIMSTDNKIYPSKFLCLNLDFLNNEDSAQRTIDFMLEKASDDIINNIKDYDGTITLTQDCLEYWFNDKEPDQTKVHETRINDSVLVTWNAGTVVDDVMLNELKSYKGGHIEIRCYYNHKRIHLGNDPLPLRPIPFNIENKNSNTITLFGMRDQPIDHTIILRYDIKKLPNQINFLDKIGYNGDLDNLTKEIIYAVNKRKLIEFLISYYENKLATVRDWCIDKNKNQEYQVRPLSWLFDALKIIGWDGNIVALGDVTEQDWNGSFADTICVLDMANFKKASLETTTNNSITTINTNNESVKYLHGWWENKNKYDVNLDFDHDGIISLSVTKDDSNKLFEYELDKQIDDEDLQDFINTHVISTGTTDDYNTFISQNPRPNTEAEIRKWEDTLKAIVEAATKEEIWHGPSIAKGIKPLYDSRDKTTYQLDATNYTIKLEKSDDTTIEFNVVIPLFDLTDTNYKTNSVMVSDVDEISLTPTTNDEKKLMSVQNVPLGIWFSGPNGVSLSSDKSTGFAPSWSLCLSSQFKPFPYSTKMPSEITDDSKKAAFATFSQILSRQNTLIDKLNSMTDIVNALSSRVTALESQMGSILTTYNIDTFKQDISNYKTEINNRISELESKITALDLKWVDREG